MSLSANTSAFSVAVLQISHYQPRIIGSRTPLIHSPLKCRKQRPLIRASSGDAPKTKSSFYKNPSKAIEKGGGFYFPGLRGPRLRLFVTAVGLGLLSINHLASIRASMAIPSSFTISEIGALLALLCVFSSAYVDITQATEEETKVKEDAFTEPQALSQQTSDGSKMRIVPYDGITNAEEVFGWVASVAVRMTDVDGVYVFKGDTLAFSFGPVSNRPGCGEVVARVAREDKSLYVDDSSRLPQGVDVPFLDPAIDRWSLFLVPICSGNFVVVFCSALDSEENPKLSSPSDRNWLKQCSNRIQVEV